MLVEQKDEVADPVALPFASASASAPVRVAGEPPQWLIVGLAAAYVVALAVLAFLPGATLIERLRALDGGICAQASGHSFFVGGEQLPLCSRNTGIYLGFTCAFLVLLATGRLRSAGFPGRWVMLVLGIAVLFMAEDGFNSLFLDLGLPHLYQPHNILRLFSGLGTGTAMCAFIVPVANTLIWRDEDHRSSFRSLNDLGLMIPVLLLAFLAVGTFSDRADFLLYPIALLSSAGLVMALTLVNVVFFLSFSTRAGHFASWRQFFPFFTVAVVFAVIELMALFALKTSMLHSITSIAV
jgi:uncharacterized membrane protein